MLSCALVISAVGFPLMLRSPAGADPRSRRTVGFRIGFCCGGLLYFGTLLATQNPEWIFAAAILGAILVLISAIVFFRSKV